MSHRLIGVAQLRAAGRVVSALLRVKMWLGSTSSPGWRPAMSAALSWKSTIALPIVPRRRHGQKAERETSLRSVRGQLGAQVDRQRGTASRPPRAEHPLECSAGIICRLCDDSAALRAQLEPAATRRVAIELLPGRAPATLRGGPYLLPPPTKR